MSVVIIVVLLVLLIYSWVDRAIYNSYVERLIYRTNTILDAANRLEKVISSLDEESEAVGYLEGDIRGIREMSERGEVKHRGEFSKELTKLRNKNSRLKY